MIRPRSARLPAAVTSLFQRVGGNARNPTVVMEDDFDQSWRAVSAAPIPARHWDGDCIVYNALSGDTHILDIVAGEILRAVMEQPMQGRALARHIAAFLEVPDDDTTAANVNQILHRLDELGLIEPFQSC